MDRNQSVSNMEHSLREEVLHFLKRNDWVNETEYVRVVINWKKKYAVSVT